MLWVMIYNASRPSVQPMLARYCDTFVCRLRGLILHKPLAFQEGLLLVYPKDSVYDSSIHMLGVRSDLAVAWINKAGQVVDAILAKKWRLAYFPNHPAAYVLEMAPERQRDFCIGDWVRFEEEVKNVPG